MTSITSPAHIARDAHRPRLLVAAFVVLSLLLGTTTAVYGQASPPAIGRWVRLAPAGIGPITNFALTPGWPGDGVLLAVRGTNQLARTTDGGATWEILPAPTGNLGSAPQLALADNPLGGRLAFLGPMDEGGATHPPLLYRSSDDGATWQVVLDRPSDLLENTSSRLTATAGLHAQLVVSPGFARDGLAFAIISCPCSTSFPLPRLARSTDGGATWTILDPAPGRVLRRIVFSPTFDQDASVFLVTGKDPRPWWDPDRGTPPSPGWLETDQPPPSEPALLQSNDAGDTWIAPSDELLGADVQLLAPSLDLAHDGTLFATASGVSRVVRSQDWGVSWQPLAGAGTYPPLGGIRSLALSPTFAQDGVGLVVGNNSLGHGSMSCDLERTADGGRTWARVPITPPDAQLWANHLGCGQARLLNGPRNSVGLLNIGSLVLWSSDAGQTWTAIIDPDGQPAERVEPSPAFPEDPTLLVMTNTGSRKQTFWTVSLDLGER